ncbi:VWA domain-containing protein [Streptomyces sp. NPDC057271]|uniref:VWA domain-containing protein n=1 Tax=Streptomyces sp. NPDC057271 TaxID=3346078 RepID=UPI003635DE9E
MGIRSLLRKVFGRDRAERQADSPATSVPPQAAPSRQENAAPTPPPTEDEAQRAADDLVAAAFDNPKVPAARTSEKPDAEEEPAVAGLPKQATTEPVKATPAAEEPAAEATVEAVATAEEPATDAAAEQVAVEATDVPTPVADEAKAETAHDEPVAEKPVAETPEQVAAEPQTEPAAATEPEAGPVVDEAIVAEPEATPAAEPAEAESEATPAEAEPTEADATAAEPEATPAAEPVQAEPTRAEADATVAEATPAEAEPTEVDATVAEPEATPAAEPVQAEPTVAVAGTKATPADATVAETEAAPADADATVAEPEATPTPAPAPAPAPAPGRTVLTADAPQLVEAYDAAAGVLAERGLVGAGPVAVYLVVDRSGSMRGYFKDGSVQRIAEQTVALAAHLTEDATVTAVFFSTDIDGTAELRPAGIEGRIDEINAGLGRLGRTNYHRAVEEVLAHHEKTDPTRPAFVVFQTDGAPESKTAATQALAEAAGRPIHWQFVAWGEEDNKAFDFVRKLTAPRTGHYLAGPTPAETAHADFYRGLLSTWEA